MQALHSPAMLAAGMDTAAWEAWARAKGATPAAARVLAKAALARLAQRGTDAVPARRLWDAAASEADWSLPQAQPAPAADGTVRFAVRLADGALVETVSIAHPTRSTVCVSSQAGCARGCVFCETGRLGLARNLEAGEIVGQYALVARHRAAQGLPAPTNVVFMGMGEPLDNLDAVLQAARVLGDSCGFAVAPRRITVSTVGVVPGMHALWARSSLRLALSLHAADDEERRRLVPAARTWDLAALREALAAAPDTVLVQWTLIDGVNDSPRHAEDLLRFCAGLDVRVNVIPLNPGPAETLRAPTLEHVRAFQKRLADGGVRCLVRLPHGQEVGGACGQLAGALRGAARPLAPVLGKARKQGES